MLYKREQVRQNLLVNDSEKTIVMFSCKNNLQFFLASLMDFTLTGHSNQHRRFSTNYLQFMDSLCATCIFLPASKHPTSYEDVFRHTVSEAAKLVVKVFSRVVFADFETAIYNAVPTVWPGLEVKTGRFHLRQSWWRKIQSLGLSKQYGKEDYEVIQFLKKIIGLSLLPPAEVCDCFALEFLSNLPNDKRVEQFCDLLTYLLTYLLTPWSRVPLEKLTSKLCS